MQRNRSPGLVFRPIVSILILMTLVLPISVLIPTGPEGATNVTANIVIDGNAALISSPYRSPGGQGIDGDPYIFEDLTMNTKNIQILNTDVSFIFRNITFASSTSIAMYIENVQNGIFSNISSNYRPQFLQVIDCTDITLRGSNVINAYYSGSYLIFVRNTVNFTMLSSNFSKSNGLSSCYIMVYQDGEKLLIENNTFRNMRVYDRRFDDNELISNNSFINSSLILGYDIYNVEGSISHNEFQNSTLDIHKAQRKCVIDNNSFYNDEKNCIELDYTYECTIEDNYISGNYGIYFQTNTYSAGGKEAYIQNNIFEDCIYGINTFNNNQNRPFRWKIYSNYFGNCSGYAIHLGYGFINSIWNNIFYHNAGTDNTSLGFQVYHTYNYGSTWGNVYTVGDVGNFWSNYRAPDIDNNGIVDDALYIASGGINPVDLYPSTNPYFDTTPPLISILAPSGFYEDNSYFILEWNAYDPTSGIEFTELKIDDNDPIDMGNSGKKSIYLESGDHDLDLVAFNRGGLYNNVQKFIHVNKTVDIITINQPLNGSFLRGTERYIQWSIIAEYLIDNLTIIVDGIESYHETDIRDIQLELDDGEHTVVIRARDLYGMVFKRMVNFIVDNKAPTITINAPTPYSYLSNNDVHFNWDLYDRFGINSQFIRFDEGDWIDNTGASNAIWIYGPGPHTCDIKAFDMAGNEAIFHIPLFLGPDLRFELMEPSDNTYTTERDHNLKWKYSGPLNWTTSLIKIGENANFIDIAGVVEYPFKLHKDGEYLITLRLQDGFDNYAEATITVIKDTIEPKVLFRSPSNNSMFSEGEVSITWRGEDEFGIKEFLVRIDEGEWEGYGNSTIYDGIFDEGTHRIEITAIDNAGNTGYGLLSFSIDSEKPTITITSPVDGTFTNGNYVNINWEITEPNGIGSINLTVNGQTFVDLIDSTFYDYPTPKEIEYLFMITVVDLAGNSNSDSVTIYNDRTRPDIEWIGLPEYFTNRSSLDFSWKITEQYLRNLVFGYGDIEQDLLLDQTSITIEVEEGDHEFYIKAEDMVGNVFSISHDLIVDQTPPSITIDWDRTLIKDGSASIYWSTKDNGSSELMIEIDDGSGFREALLGDRYTSDKLAQGNYHISIRATDEAGNTDTKTWEFFVNSQGGIGEKPDDEGSSAPMIIGIMVLLIILIVVILIFVNRTKRNREEKKEITKAPGKPRKIHISTLIPQVPTHGHAHARSHVHSAPLHTSVPAPTNVQTSKVPGEDSGYIRPRSRSTKKAATRDKDTFKTHETIDKKRVDHPVQKENKRPEKEKDTKYPSGPEVPVVDLPEDEDIRSWDDEEEIPSWDDSDEIFSTDKGVKKGGRKDVFPQEVDDDHIVFDDDEGLDEMEEFEEFENFE